MIMNTAQKAAANDLALFAVNTANLYAAAKVRMRRIATAREADRVAIARDQWMAHALAAKEAYGQEMGVLTTTYRQAYDLRVIVAAADLIADHYAEEQADITGGNP